MPSRLTVSRSKSNSIITAGSSPTTQPSCPGSIRDRLRSRELHRASVGILNMDLPVREKSHVRVLAQFRPHDYFHVARPEGDQDTRPLRGRSMGTDSHVRTRGGRRAALNP
jgi:hypothetical protein